MAITLPFGAGVIAAFIFLLFELLVFPVLMHITSTLASFFIIRRATHGKPVHVRSISYPLWNEGLLNRQPSHVLLFLIRLTCIVIPVYLETRFISRSTPIAVSKLIPHAFVCNPENEDLILHGNVNELLLRREIFSRCAAVDDEGWLKAKIANVTLTNDGEEIRCIRGTEQTFYRALERLPPFVEPSKVETKYFIDKTPVYRPNLTLKVQIEERPFQELLEQPVVGEEKIDTMHSQVQNVTVLDTEDMECSPWPTPWPSTLLRANSFICQNVTGRIVDFYFTSIQNLINESNTRVLARHGNIVLKQFTVSTTFKFIGSLEFKDRIWINAGLLIRSHPRPPDTAHLFEMNLRFMLYTRASNVTVKVPGGEVFHSVELDNVVVLVYALEVGVVLVIWLSLVPFSRYRWTDMQRANTIDGLSYIWSQNNARWGGLVKHSRISLRLCKRMLDGEERFVYQPEGLELKVETMDHTMDEEVGRGLERTMFTNLKCF